MEWKQAYNEVLEDHRKEFIKDDEILDFYDGIRIFCKNPRAHVGDNYIINLEGEWHLKLK